MLLSRVALPLRYGGLRDSRGGIAPTAPGVTRTLPQWVKRPIFKCLLSLAGFAVVLAVHRAASASSLSRCSTLPVHRACRDAAHYPLIELVEMQRERQRGPVTNQRARPSLAIRPKLACASRGKNIEHKDHHVVWLVAHLLQASGTVAAVFSRHDREHL